MDKEETNGNTDINSSVLNIVNDAAPHRVALNTVIANRIKSARREYMAMKMCAEPAYVALVAKKKPRDRTPAENELLKEWFKRTKAEFNTLKRFLYPTNPLASPMESLADKIVLIVQMLRYIGVTDFDDVLKQHGMHIDAAALESTNAYWEKPESKELAKGIFERVREIVISEINENAAIREVKYGELPREVTYAPDNKGGLTVSQFVKMVKTRAVGMMKDVTQYSAYKERIIEKDKGAIESAEMTLNLIKEIQ